MSRARLRSYRRYYARRLFPKTKNPVPVAAAVFIGVFLGVLPTLGVALLLTALTAALLRVPKAPALVSSFVATPPTLFFFFYPLGYLVGLHLIDPPPIGVELLPAIRELNLWNASAQLSMLWADARWHVFAFVLGMFIVAAVTATLAAVATLVVMQRRTRRRAAP